MACCFFQHREHRGHRECLRRKRFGVWQEEPLALHRDLRANNLCEMTCHLLLNSEEYTISLCYSVLSVLSVLKKY